MTVHTLLVKISHKLRKEIGCNFHFVELAAQYQLTDIKNEQFQTAQRNSTSNRIYCGRDILLPIVIDRVFKGAVVISDGITVNNRDLDVLERFVRGCVVKNISGDKSEPDFEPWYRYVDGVTDEENVIYLSQVKRQRERIMGTENLWRGGVVFVQAMEPESVQKVAVDIFRDQGSTGLVPWFALDPLNSVECIKDLGRITIFVTNISDLSESQQELIEKYLNEACEEDTPKFIIGAQKSLEVLMNEGQTRKGLLALMNTPQVRLNPSANSTYFH